MKTRHPATYSNALLPVMADYLHSSQLVLDVFGGTGKIALIREHGYQGQIYCNELEPEWSKQSPHYKAIDRWIFGDACNIDVLDDASIPAICTSPCYGNRMADSALPKNDGYVRNTYTHGLGKKLREGNAGALQWGEAYKKLHLKAWVEALRLLEPKGLLIVNVSNHIRNYNLWQTRK